VYTSPLLIAGAIYLLYAARQAGHDLQHAGVLVKAVGKR
jgi:hypothetical protein